MNSISSIHAADIARQQMARNAEAARTYTQRHAAEEPGRDLVAGAPSGAYAGTTPLGQGSSASRR